MEIERTFRVVGIERETSRDVSFLVAATAEGDARARAEQSGVSVTAVTEEMGASAGAAAKAEPLLQKPARFLAWRIVGSLVGAFSLLGGCGLLLRRNHVRQPFIDAVMGGDGAELGRMVGYLIGSNVFALITLGIALKVMSGSRGRKGWVLLITSILAMGVTTAGVLRPTSERVKRERALKDLSKMVDAVVPAAGQAPTVPEQPIGSEEAHGDMAYALNVTQTYVKGLLKDKQEYEAGIAAINLGTVLAPSRLDSEAELRDSMATLDAAVKLFEVYKGAVQGRIQTARDMIEKAPVAQEMKRGMRQGFESGIAKTWPMMLKVMECDAEVYAETRVVLELMLTQQGKVKLAGEQLLLDDDEAIDAYNQSVGRIQAISARQTALLAELQDLAKANAARMKAGDAPVLDAPKPLAKPLVVELEKDRCVVQGKVIALPGPLADLQEVLGTPSRTMDIEQCTVHVWDARGVYALTDKGEDQVNVLTFALNRQVEHEYTPKETFKGRIVIGGVEVGELDTPRSLNRRMKSVAFAREGDEWIVDMSTYIAGMDVLNDGLVDELYLVLKRAEPEKKDGEAPPRF